MKTILFKCFALVLLLITFCFCSDSKNESIKSKKTCLYGLCFNKEPKLIDSLLNESNHNGILLKVYSLELNKDELQNFQTSLLKKKYKKFPMIEFYEMPKYLKPHVDNGDFAFYKYEEKEEYGFTIIILDLTKQKLILYDYGFLKDSFI